MDDSLFRVWHDLVARTTGPMWFRLILQPLIATVFGIRAGLANARAATAQGQLPPSQDAGKRRTLFRQALHDVGKMFLIGVALDVVFQLLALRTVYPLEAVLVGFFLVAVPYQIVRTIVALLASRSSS